MSHAHEVIDAIEYEVKEDVGVDLVCHLDPYPINDPDFKRIAPELKKTLKDIHPHLRFHDLRVDKTTTPETIYFDLVVPEELKKTENSHLQDIISQHFIAQNEPAKLNITFDRTYLLWEKNRFGLVSQSGFFLFKMHDKRIDFSVQLRSEL